MRTLYEVAQYAGPNPMMNYLVNGYEPGAEGGAYSAAAIGLPYTNTGAGLTGINNLSNQPPEMPLWGVVALILLVFATFHILSLTYSFFRRAILPPIMH